MPKLDLLTRNNQLCDVHHIDTAGSLEGFKAAGNLRDNMGSACGIVINWGR